MEQTTVILKESKIQNVFSEIGKFLKLIGRKFMDWHILTYLVLGIFSLLIIVPLVWIVLSSFKSTNDVVSHNAFSFPTVWLAVNYANAWVNAQMGNYLINSVLITAVSLGLLVLLSVPCAYVLARFRFKGSMILSTLIMAGIFINVNYIVVPIYTMVNSVGKLFGANLTDQIVTVMIVYATTSIPFAVYLLMGYLKSLPSGYEEAARIDGCGYFGTLFKIVVPLSMPSIITVLLFNFLKFWNEYIIAQTFLVTTSKWTISEGLLNIMQVDRAENDFGRMYAGLVIVMLPTLIFYAFVQGKLTSGISIGGLKG